MTEPTARVLVLTEDGGADSVSTVAKLVERMVAYADDACETHLLAFDALADEGQRNVLAGMKWKGEPAPHGNELRKLCQSIATRLLEPDGFVAFHFDGDVRWSERPGPNEREFEKVIWRYVEALLDDALAPKPVVRSRVRPVIETPVRPSRTKCEALWRLIVLIPHYSVESWLCQNTARAVALCREHHQGAHAASLEAWAEARPSLDELMYPKRVLCLHDAHNLDLASNAFPTAAVHGGSPSFTQAVDQISNCRPLIEALKPDYGRLGADAE